MDKDKVIQKFGKIGVLMGGISSERAISLKSGEAVYSALKEYGFDAIKIDITESDYERISKQIESFGLDLAFIVLHGKFGEDGEMQKILEELGVIYTGSGVVASRLALNKVLTQNLLKNHGITVPNYVSLSGDRREDVYQLVQSLGDYPLVVKPACEGSSIGISVVNEVGQLNGAVDLALSLDSQVLIEKFIEGRELTVGILGQRTLPIVEIRYNASFFDFDSKYGKEHTLYDVPANIDQDMARKISDAAYEAYRLIGCDGFARVDFILNQEGKFYLLEINTIPGFTKTSLLPKAAIKSGINFIQLCIEIMESAYGKKKEKRENFNKF